MPARASWRMFKVDAEGKKGSIGGFNRDDGHSLAEALNLVLELIDG